MKVKNLDMHMTITLQGMQEALVLIKMHAVVKSNFLRHILAVIHFFLLF